MNAQRQDPNAAMRLNTHLRLAGLVGFGVVGLLIALATLTPAAHQPGGPAGLDKVFHGLAWATLIFPLIATDNRRWVWAVPLCIAYGGAIELIQPSVGRAAEWLDFGADVAGVLAGAALGEMVHSRLRPFIASQAGDSETPKIDAERRRVAQMRAEMREELRAVLREELSALPPRADPRVAPSSPNDEAADPPQRLH